MVSILPAMQEARSHAKNERVKWGKALEEGRKDLKQ